MEARILIEDEHLIAIRKNAGELVVADRFGIEKNILLHQLGEFLRARGHQKDESGRDLYPVHRLDRDTSGVVLFAKNQAAHRELSILFENRKMQKTYWAFTAGVPIWDRLICKIPLSRAEGKKGRGRALIDLNSGKEAETEFAILERFGDIAWIEAKPHTGRLHQIRVHLKALGYPILWDHTYWDQEWVSSVFPNLKEIRMPLHARSLEFRHPFTEKEVKIESPLGEELREFFHFLKEFQKSSGKVE